jgi:mono/diheme cytochrome c family protein
MQKHPWRFGLFAVAVSALPIGLACSSPSDSAADSSDATEATQDGGTAAATSSSAATPAAQGSGAAPTSTSPAPSTTTTTTGSAWCDVSAILAKSCQSCHGSTQVLGLVPRLVSWEDLQAPQGNGAKMFDLVKESIHAPIRQMPPVGRLSDAELKTIDDWIASGAKNSDRACGGSPSSPAPPSTGPAATSGNPCATSAQCALGQVCRGTCIPGCDTNNDCASGTVCVNGQCGGGSSGTEPDHPIACVMNAQCPASAPRCFRGQCFALPVKPAGICIGALCF